MSTSPKVSFGLFELAIKMDSSLSFSRSLQPFSKLMDVQFGASTNRAYASYEPDFWLLDGQYKFLPDNYQTVHVGLMSLEMSDENGDFATPPALTINFQQVHSCDGLALRFSLYSGDYANDIDIAFYDATLSPIRNDNYQPSDVEFSTGQPVDDFKRIVITFNATNRPYRYLRLSAIDYGELISFDGSSIQAAWVVEDTDPLSSEVRVNTLDLELISPDAQFSIINPEGDYASLTERQPLAVYEIVEGNTVFIGQYYLDEWENLSDTQSLFHATDLLGVLDRMTCRGGIWLGAGILLEDLLDDLLEPINVPYELDSDLYGTTVRGWLPISSYREALQQIGFAVGASVDCSRSMAIRIFQTKIAADEAASGTITAAEKGVDQRLALRSQVTEVEVVAHNYVATSTSKQLFNGSLGAGLHEIVFSDPMHSLTPSGASIVESGVNYAILEVTTPGTVTLSGQEYVDTTGVTRVTTPDLPVGVRPNVVSIEEATLVSNSNVVEVTDRVYRYYQQRYRQTLRLFQPSVEVGQVVLADTLYDKQIRGTIETMELDLAMGMTGSLVIVGVENV